MSRSEALVDGWLTARLTAQIRGCRQPELAGNLPAEVDGSTCAKCLSRNEVDGIDGTSPAREAGAGAGAGTGAGRHAPASCATRSFRQLQKKPVETRTYSESTQQLLPSTVPAIPATGLCAVNQPWSNTMKHRIARNKALSRAIRSKVWDLTRDPALLAKMEAWLEHVVARAEQQAGRELVIEEALDCVTAATYADFDVYDKQALGDLAVALERELQRVRGLLELAKA